MNVLLAVASRHGATWEIGASIASVLTARGQRATLLEPAQVGSVDGYDAVVVGSAVYLTSLLPDARDLVERFGPELQARPLWLFASGLASPSSGARTTTELAALGDQLGARDHRLFRGRLDRAGLSFAERVAAAGVLNREGDHRDFAAIERWAGGIADELEQVQAERARATA
ncbi:MAG: flavodoxin domain-containing protein [Actinobacteria bacterium]|nr:flavodoxin domain-containing protein [Actinomycetota bacterium]MCG2803205.1 flavodoxin domain-containing protein [Cellulomonas sp.]